MVPVSLQLENVTNWKNSWTERGKSEVSFYKMPIITDGNQLYVFGREKSKSK